MLDADEGYDAGVTARVGSAWKKFCDYSLILTGKGFLMIWYDSWWKARYMLLVWGVVWCMAVRPGAVFTKGRKRWSVIRWSYDGCATSHCYSRNISYVRLS